MTLTTNNAHLTRAPSGHAAMLIRSPVAGVFAAIVDPAITSKFWFARGSGRLEPGKRVQWDWGMHDISIQVDVKEIEPNRRILFEWPGYSGPTAVEWVFSDRGDGTTFLEVTESGFLGDADQIVKQAIASTGGFTLVLAGLKAVLEHDVRLNLVRDRFPDSESLDKYLQDLQG